MHMYKTRMLLSDRPTMEFNTIHINAVCCKYMYVCILRTYTYICNVYILYVRMYVCTYVRTSIDTITISMVQVSSLH